MIHCLWISGTVYQKNITKRFWIFVLEEFSIDYPNIAELVLILLAISPGTVPVEKELLKISKNVLQGSSSNFIINIGSFISLVLSTNWKLWWWTFCSSEKSLEAIINTQLSKARLSLVLFVLSLKLKINWLTL